MLLQVGGQRLAGCTNLSEGFAKKRIDFERTAINVGVDLPVIEGMTRGLLTGFASELALDD